MNPYNITNLSSTIFFTLSLCILIIQSPLFFKWLRNNRTVLYFPYLFVYFFYCFCSISCLILIFGSIYLNFELFWWCVVYFEKSTRICVQENRNIYFNFDLSIYPSLYNFVVQNLIIFNVYVQWNSRMTSLDLFIEIRYSKGSVIPAKGNKEEFIVMNGRCVRKREKIFAVSEMHRSLDHPLCDTRALVILILGSTGGNCAGRRHESLHSFVCTVAMQARQNAQDFFPIQYMKNFGAFFPLHPHI